MGPDGKGTDQAAVYIDGQPVQYAGEITLPEITAAPWNSTPEWPKMWTI